MQSTNTSIVLTACETRRHEDTHVPHAEVEQRKLDAVVIGSISIPVFTIPIWRESAAG